MDVPAARRMERPSWVNIRTVLGLMLFCTALLGGRALLAASKDTVPVWSAARDLAPGTVLADGDLVAVDVLLNPVQAGRYASAEASLGGAVVARPVLAGELLPGAALGDPASPGRTMAIPVEPEHSVGGTLGAGDRIDVLATFDAGDDRARTVLLVRAVEVLEVMTAGGVVLGEETVAGITVAVSPQDAQRLAFAIRTAEIDVVRVEGVGSETGTAGTVRREDFE